MINRITNANAYLNGETLIGRLEEIELPSIKFATEDVKALGLFAAIEMPTGLEKMEAKLKWNAVYGDNFKAESPLKSVSITVKSNMKSQGAAGSLKDIPVSVTISGVFKETPLGTLKGQEKIDGLQHVMSVYYVKLEEDGKLIYEVDVFNNIIKFGSTDILNEFRLNQ
jgi:P2 family phage contractile tail tube protein